MISSKPVPTFDLLSRRFSRRRTTAIVLLASLLIISLLISRQRTHHTSLASPSSQVTTFESSLTVQTLLHHLSPRHTSFTNLVALSDSHRADALAYALQNWTSGPLPSIVTVAAAVCSTRDVADALLRGDLSQVLVIDVGARKGHPVTYTALQRLARLVVSIEPDPRNFLSLAALPVSPHHLFAPINAPLTQSSAYRQINLTHPLANLTCPHCLPESTHVSTIDSLLLDGHILDKAKFIGNLDLISPTDPRLQVRLLKSHTYGHETQVLAGANRLLATGRVENIIIDFNPQLMLTKANALQTLQHLFNAGFSCTQLAFSSLTDNEKNSPVYPFFGRVPITNVTAERFYDFVRYKRKTTDILCSKR